MIPDSILKIPLSRKPPKKPYGGFVQYDEYEEYPKLFSHLGNKSSFSFFSSSRTFFGTSVI
ncbi:MAG: hypothetical protein XE11_1174 [Methanomicrobiales archaeon 53_19]|jgi:hypothetical protein|nr:MAG: hypothetical protein XD88_0866 [Methanocalculus sp. 52_23]KUL03564.1 MAG: hypothetical protein XE11_1174 [Methanomicrobiales archaeon 53_19]